MLRHGDPRPYPTSAGIYALCWLGFRTMGGYYCCQAFIATLMSARDRLPIRLFCRYQQSLTPPCSAFVQMIFYKKERLQMSTERCTFVFVMGPPFPPSVVTEACGATVAHTPPCERFSDLHNAFRDRSLGIWIGHHRTRHPFLSISGYLIVIRRCAIIVA